MLKQKTGLSTSATTDTSKSDGVQIKSVSASGNIKIGLKEVKVVSSIKTASGQGKSATVVSADANKKDALQKETAPKQGAKAAVSVTSHDTSEDDVKAIEPVSVLQSAAQQISPSVKKVKKKRELSSLTKLGAMAASLGGVALLLGVSYFGGETSQQPVAAVQSAAVAPVLPAVVEPVAAAPTQIKINEAELGLLLGAAQAAELNTPNSSAPVAPAEVDAMVSKITAGTLAALRSPTPKAEAQPVAPTASAEVLTGLVQLVMTAVAEGKSEDQINEMLNTGYANGEIAVPSVLVDAHGRVSTATLMALLVAE